MNCKFCKKEIDDGFVFCPWCGRKQERATGKKRHGNGQGSVWKRGKTWTAAKVFGYKPDGKAIRTTKGGFATAKEARDYLTSLEPKKPSMIFSDIFAAAMEQYKGTEKSAELMRNAYAHLLPFHNKEIEAITIDAVQNLFDGFDFSRSYQEKIKGVLRLVYGYAVPRDLCSKDISSYIKISGEDGSRDAFTREELEKIRNAIDVVPEADLIYIHCYLGYRPSEFLSRRIEAHYLPQEQAIFGGSKTEAGKNRVVTISPKIALLVEKRVGVRKEGFMFCRADGSPYDKDSYYKVFKKVMRAVGIRSTPDHHITP